MTYVLLTRAPLYWGRSPFSHDLHVLGAPLTFVLSQDQTLQFNPSADPRRTEPRPCERRPALRAAIFRDAGLGQRLVRLLFASVRWTGRREPPATPADR